jgi:hypothetical protein
VSSGGVERTRRMAIAARRIRRDGMTVGESKIGLMVCLLFWPRARGRDVLPTIEHPFVEKPFSQDSFSLLDDGWAHRRVAKTNLNIVLHTQLTNIPLTSTKKIEGENDISKLVTIPNPLTVSSHFFPSYHLILLKSIGPSTHPPTWYFRNVSYRDTWRPPPLVLRRQMDTD